MKLVDWLAPFKTLLQPPVAAKKTPADPAAATVHAQALVLAEAPVGQACRIAGVHPPETAPEWARWLAEIGFLPGERASVRARSPWGDGALVVRIGTSTFALRREEAACVCVVLECATAR